jgi:hypothetical protein
MDHYDCEAERTNARCANENGDVESSNGHLKDRIEHLAHLNRLPAEQLDTDDLMLGVKVSRSSTIRIRIKHVFRPQSADRQSRRCSHRC